MKNLIRNEHGLSLVEVIASIVLLSIIVMAFITIFPQMKNSNEITGENLNAANIAKELLVVIKQQSYEELSTRKPVDDFTYTIVNNNPLTLDGHYKYINGKEVLVRVTIQSSTASSDITLREMLIEIMNENKNVIAKIHGYLPE